LACAECDEESAGRTDGQTSGPGRPIHWLKAFWYRAYRENVTGLSAMVAYNLLLAVFPFSLLVLFIFSQVLKVEGIEASVYADLQRLFPSASENTLRDILDSIRTNSAAIGVVAIAASIWIGASFWGAMDTAFCRIYHVRCRGWWEQKRFSLVMLLVVVAFFLGTVILPAIEGALLRSTDGLPFGLNEVQSIDDFALFVLTLGLNFLVCSLIFWLVPKGHMPWSAVWPGAVFTTAVSGIANWLFPLYLNNVSTLSLFGTTAAFILIALLWFYVVALTLLAGAVINSLRHEYRDTGLMPYGLGVPKPRLEPTLAEPDRALPMAEPYRSLTANGNGHGGGNGNGSGSPAAAGEQESPKSVTTDRDAG
jgi:YihY family inner membrane protein